MPKHPMDPQERSKIMHAARLVIDGSFKSQRAACRALNMPLKLGGRVSDAHSLLMHGIPELVAVVESGELPFQTGWQISQRIPREEQLAILERIQEHRQDGNEYHGLYARLNSTKRVTRLERKEHRIQRKTNDRICEAVDKLLDAIMERIGALGVCTKGAPPTPDPELAKRWRIAIRRTHKAMTTLDHLIDWSKAETKIESKLEGDGDRHVTTTADNNGNGPQD